MVLDEVNDDKVSKFRPLVVVHLSLSKAPPPAMDSLVNDDKEGGIDNIIESIGPQGLIRG